MRKRAIATNSKLPVASARRLSESLRGHLYTVLQTMRGRPLARCIGELRHREQLPQDEFDRLLHERIDRMLDHARSQVPLYRFGPWRNVSKSSKICLDEWPVLEKSHLQAHFNELQAENRDSRFEKLRTSGTTGKPTHVASSYLASTYGWAHRYRALQWHGIPIGARSLRLTHDRRPLRDLLLGQKCVWPVDSHETLSQAMEYLVAKRPTLVAGTPSALFYLARRLREEGVTAPLAPFARVGGEQLYSFQREYIESYLCHRAIDSYGTTETGAVAGECPAGSMHTYSDHIHLEIFKNDAPAHPGEFGDIVVTSLYNWAMPLIRYRVSDRGRLSPEGCACGLPYPVLTDLQARSNDCYVLADGSTQHNSTLVEQLGRVFDGTLGDFVRQFQLRQNDPVNWEAWVEGSNSLISNSSINENCAEIRSVFTNIIQRAAGSECKVLVHFVNQLPREHGKFRYIGTAHGSP
jgi:phenylacetate-CoA ligase